MRCDAAPPQTRNLVSRHLPQDIGHFRGITRCANREIWSADRAGLLQRRQVDDARRRLFEAAVLRVLDDADDLYWRRTAVVTDLECLTDRIGSAKEVTSRSLVDDRDSRGAFIVPRPESAAAENVRTHRLEEAR